MHAGQYKRIYNLAFALALICTFLSGFKISKSAITKIIIQPQEEELHKVAHDEEIRMYNDLIKQGKIEEAKDFLVAPHVMIIPIRFSTDVSESPYLQKIKWLQLRINFFSDNLALLSTIATLLAYMATYFLVWFSACRSLRYVRNAPKASPL